MLANVQQIVKIVVIAIAAATVAGTVYARFAPLEAPGTRLVLPGLVVLDASGTVLHRDGRRGFRLPVALSGIAPAMLEATISAEDRRFLAHPGIDPIAIPRAPTPLRTAPAG